MAAFHTDIQLTLHPTLTIATARYKVINLGDTDADAANVLKDLVVRSTATKESYFPAFEYYALQEEGAFFRQAGKRREERRSADILSDSATPGGCGGQRLYVAPKPAHKPAAAAGAPCR